MNLSQLNFEDPVVLVMFVAIPVFCLATLMVFAFAVRMQMKVSASRRWETTSGRIITSETEKRMVRGNRGSFQAYFPKVVYEYRANGRPYQGDKISFGEFAATNRPDPAIRKLAQYPVHGTVEVFYNPENPAEAVLERTTPQAKILWLVVGIMLLLILLMAGLAWFLGTILPRMS